MTYAMYNIMVIFSFNYSNRNKIIFQGSASKIRDDIKVLSEHDRE